MRFAGLLTDGFPRARHHGVSDSLCAAGHERAQSGKVELVTYHRTSKDLIRSSADKPKW
jgi:hypothetical protein